MNKKQKRIINDTLITIFLVTLATGIGLIFRSRDIQMTNVVVVYIFSVILTARYTNGYFYGILGTIISLLAFNWFFTEPIYSFDVNDLTYMITFCTMALTSVITSALTSKFKQAAAEAREKEKESNALYQLTTHLTEAKNIDAIAEVTVKTASKILSSDIACVCFEEDKNITSFIHLQSDGKIIHRELDDGGELKGKMEALHSNYEVGQEFCDWPIYGRNNVLGALRIPVKVNETMSKAQTRLILSVLENTALAMERFKSLEAQAQSRQEMERERYRSNLLRAISHDIRTPLTGILGSSEMLMSILNEKEYPYQLAEGIYKDAEWLHSMVENILNLTRLQDVQLPLEKEPEAVEEVLGAAVHTASKHLSGREISIDIPDSVIIVPMNARLINQVLINLINNAAEHSPQDTPINIKVETENNDVKFTITDCGDGIPEADMEKIFQMFYTTNKKSADSRRGVGLGLAICQSIVKAHEGTIYAKNREGTNGAEFIFTLPMGGNNEKR